MEGALELGKTYKLTKHSRWVDVPSELANFLEGEEIVPYEHYNSHSNIAYIHFVDPGMEQLAQRCYTRLSHTWHWQNVDMEEV